MSRVLVVGAGATGAAVARALASRGEHVVLVDAADGEAQRQRTAALGGVEVRLGADLDRSELLDGVDLVVPSPGVPPGHALLTAAARRGVPVRSEPELAWRLATAPPRVVAVTGTNGKTTTTQLLADCLDAPAVGNIGTPMIEVLADAHVPPVVVAELSSFQLHFSDTLRADVGVLLNLAPDHLDWHGSLEAYRQAKARVWANQRPIDWAVVNADDPGARGTVEAHPPPGRVAWFRAGEPADGEVGLDGGWLVQRLLPDAPEKICAVESMALRGPHNLSNACATVAAALAAGADPGRVAHRVASFAPGAHRMELVAERDGVAWVDDSKATNPHAAAAALASYRSVIWIAGGLNKGLSFEALAEPVRRHVRLALTIGSSGPEVAAMSRAAGVPVIETVHLDEAVRQAASVARPGDTVLLSPACASMDQFRDYAERGRRFRELVGATLGAGPGGDA